MFDRKDLETGPHHVVNSRYGTGHVHEFENGLDAHYEKARSRHDHLCKKMRRIVHGTIPTLFVINALSGEDHAVEVTEALRDINPKLAFHVLHVPKTYKPPTFPDPDDWQDNHDHWTEAFSGMTVGRDHILMI